MTWEAFGNAGPGRPSATPTVRVSGPNSYFNVAAVNLLAEFVWANGEREVAISFDKEHGLVRFSRLANGNVGFSVRKHGNINLSRLASVLGIKPGKYTLTPSGQGAAIEFCYASEGGE